MPHLVAGGHILLLKMGMNYAEDPFNVYVGIFYDYRCLQIRVHFCIRVVPPPQVRRSSMRSVVGCGVCGMYKSDLSYQHTCRLALFAHGTLMLCKYTLSK